MADSFLQDLQQEPQRLEDERIGFAGADHCFRGAVGPRIMDRAKAFLDAHL